ncbi:MAG: trypsin-like peptidase domain-containing protein [Pirellulales bacterium]
MAISVTCPDCEHAFSVRDEYAGKRGKCPRCGGVFRAEPTEPAVGVAMPAALAARSGISLGGASQSNGGFAIDTAAASHPPAPTGRKSGGKAKKKPARGHQASPSMPIWGWITIAVLGVAGFVGGALVYTSRGSEAIAIAERIDDGSEADKTKQKLLDEIGGLQKEIDTLKANLVAAEKAVGSKPKGKDAFGNIEKHVIPGVVKVFPYVNGQPRIDNTASGFLIEVNGKVLVATTYRVCEGAEKIGIKLGTGTEYEAEGIVAAAENQDIVILKPKSEMPGAEPLVMAENVALNRGDTVYAIGNPGRQEFTTSRGVVTRVLAQDKYMEENATFDVAMRRETAANPEYIEHDARIFPGDYGGPLLNANLEVIGMNQLLVTMTLNDQRSIVQTYGAAKRIQHIKAVAAKATDTILPYPPAPKEEKKAEKKDDAKEPPADDGEAKPDDGDTPTDEPKDGDAAATDELTAKIDVLYKECDAFDWKPTSDEQYGKLTEIARRVTEAKLLTDADDGKESADEAADKVLARLNEAKWETTDAEAVNKFAAALEPVQDAGICFVGVVRGVTSLNGASAIIFQMEGSDTLAIVASEKASGIQPGTRGIVLGQFASGDKQKIKNKQDDKEFTAIMVKSKGLVTLQ